MGLLCIDIDGFTRLNHRLGNEVGDEILRQVGERIGRSIRGSDMAARTAGDECSVVVTAMGLPGDGPIVAVRLLLSLAQPYHVAGETRTIGCSIGAAYPKDAADPIPSSRSRTWVCARRNSKAAAVTGTARLVQTLVP